MDDQLDRVKLTTRQVLDHIIEGILITDLSGTIQVVNPAFCKVTGFTPEEVIGQKPSILKSGKHAQSFYRKMWTALTKTGVWCGEICNRRKNGEFYVEFLTISAVRNQAGEATHYIGVFSDVTKRKRAEELIRHMAFYDPLTDLPNRTLFRDRLVHDVATCKRSNDLLAVLFLDLDRVKIINDTLGHDVGDQLLKEVATRLTGALRQIDTIARLGGDEFMIIVPGLERADDIPKIANKILESLRPPFVFGSQQLYITASVGISVFPLDATDAETLIKNADTAMHRAKNIGRNNFQIFAPSMTQEVFEQLAMGNSLRRALDQEEFVVYYQPQIDVPSGRVIGMEALVRWQHPEFGLIPPSRFIRWAEDSGLIIPLGEWVLKRACRQVKAWRTNGHSHLRLSVNLSPKQFNQDDLVTVIAKTLDEEGLEPSALELELTESVIMENPVTAVHVSQKLRAMGIRFSIDDFGTGYSSLNYLKRLPVNTLKMDQSFVQDLPGDPNDVAIAKAVIALGHGLNLTVIAEGVETELQRDMLQSYDCDMMQGFLFGKPLPADASEAFLASHKPNPEVSLFADA